MTEFFYQFAFAQMLLCALILFPHRKQNLSVNLFILLMLSSCGYLLSYIFAPITPQSMLWWLGLIGGNALPGIFWLVGLSVFGDNRTLKPWQYLLASMTLLLPLTAKFFIHGLSINLEATPLLNGFFKYNALLLELVLISHTLLIAAQQWRNDLVQERRYIRGGVISVAGLYIILVIVIEQFFNLQWHGLELLKSLSLAALVIGVNFFLFQLRHSTLFESNNTCSEKKKHVPSQSKEVLKIIASMEQDKLYQTDGMTIASLAKHLSIHEYKLRNLINGELNYRNFNDFLNFYRIKEVSQCLLDPEYVSTPVLTLALESGFRSLSSFNKAFKATHGVTPTEFRKKKLSDS